MLIKPLIKNGLISPLIKEFQEEWRYINIYPVVPNMYMVSNTGKVINTISGKECTQGYKPEGYTFVGLRTIDGKYPNYYVHRLVATAFIPNYYNYETVNHLAEKDFNMVYSLEWMSKGDNTRDAWDTGKHQDMYNHPDGGILFTDDIVHKVCRMLTEEKDYGCILKNVNLPDNENTRAVLSRIKSGDSWTYISKQYNIENKDRRNTVEDEIIHKICKLISEGLSDPQIAMAVYGDHLNTYEKRKQPCKYVWKIRHKQRRTDISEMYF